MEIREVKWPSRLQLLLDVVTGGGQDSDWLVAGAVGRLTQSRTLVIMSHSCPKWEYGVPVIIPTRFIGCFGFILMQQDELYYHNTSS